MSGGRFGEVPGDIAIERLRSLMANDSQPPKVTLIDPDLMVRRSSGASAKRGGEAPGEPF